MKPAMVLLVLAFATVTRAETLPARGVVDPRIRTALYNPDEIYRLSGTVGYVIELIFEDGETFTGKASGDLDALDIDGYRNQVHIKPKAPLVATNLIIYTNRRAYRFDYSASSDAPTRYSSQTMYAVRFRYPPAPETPVEDRPEAKIATALAQASGARTRNFDYWFCGKHAIKPTAASDDGIHTRLTFSPRAELPAIFVRNEDGTESLLNFHVENGDIVIHRTAREFILRRGRLTGCIVNKGYSGSGDRLDSGTLSPEIHRERKEVQP